MGAASELSAACELPAGNPMSGPLEFVGVTASSLDDPSGFRQRMDFSFQTHSRGPPDGGNEKQGRGRYIGCIGTATNRPAFPGPTSLAVAKSV
jgi:hypothetical protein